MGQFDSLGLPSIGRIGLNDNDRGRGIPSPSTIVVTKKKDKPKTAAAGGGKKPPKTPPKGPTGPKNPDNYGKDNENEKKYRNSLRKGTSTNKDDKINPRDTFKRKRNNYF